MAEWLFEAGIGEDRAALVEDGTILEAVVEPHRRGLRIGRVYLVSITKVITPGVLAEGRLGSLAYFGPKGEVLVEGLPDNHRLSTAVKAVVVREPIFDGRSKKKAKLRALPLGDRRSEPGYAPPSLYEQLNKAGGARVMNVPQHGPDLLEEAGWSECLEEAATGQVYFPSGSISITPTPGGTVIDVDGWLAPEELALAAGPYVGKAIRRLGIGGSILVDFPTFAGRDGRRQVVEATIKSLNFPYEYTGVNGFGLMQIVRPRSRPSLIEEWRDHGIERAAFALVRRAQRAGLVGSVVLAAPPAVRRFLEESPNWQIELSRELGGEARVETDHRLELNSGYVRKA